MLAVFRHAPRLRSLTSALALSAGLPLGLLAAGSAQAAAPENLILDRVMLSSGGVAYFEFKTLVAGESELALPVRLDQVDDILKSLVVFDSNGQVKSVSLPGREPLRETFRDLPFGEEDIDSPVRLLNRLQGAEIVVMGSTELTGKLVRVQEEQHWAPEHDSTVTRHRVSVMTAEGLRQFVLEEVESVQFSDAALRDQIQKALQAKLSHQAKDKRTLTLSLTGSDGRLVRVAYVVEAPLWKTAYRLVLPDAGRFQPQGSTLNAHLQGWAIVENLSGQDWRDVELTLLSGNPVTFKQSLYNSYYVPRPDLPVEVFGRVMPRRDDGTVTLSSATKMEGAMPEEDGYGGLLLQQEQRGRMSREHAMDDIASSAPGMPMPMPMAAAVPAGAPAAESAEATTQVVFRYNEPLSIKNGHSFMVPLVNSAVPVERVWLYQPDTHNRHPLASIRIRNDSDSGLPPGILTLYENAVSYGQNTGYVGDAQFPVLPRHESRLLSFALDQKTLIDREDSGSQRIGRAAIADGVLRVVTTYRQQTTYRIKAPMGEARTILIEHPRHEGWKVVEPVLKAPEVTASYYRFRVPVGAGAEKVFTVAMEQPRTESIHIGSLSPDQLLARAQGLDLPASTRTAFDRIAGMQRDVAALKRNLEEVKRERKTIISDQRRLRNNLERVPTDSDLGRRYIAKLTQQEENLEAIANREEELRESLTQAQQLLRNFIAELKL